MTPYESIKQDMDNVMRAYVHKQISNVRIKELRAHPEFLEIFGSCCFMAGVAEAVSQLVLHDQN